MPGGCTFYLLIKLTNASSMYECGRDKGEKDLSLALYHRREHGFLLLAECLDYRNNLVYDV